MKYFIDTEFIEGFHKPLFGKRRHFIDLISIGIVAEDGRKYYAISTEFNPKKANDWVKENVISKLPARYVNFNGSSPSERQNMLLWKSNKRIADDINRFVLDGDIEYKMGIGNPPQPLCEFYAYYADYDWVVFCSLFGRMIDLPKGFPMYCRDLKQIMDERAERQVMQVDMTYPNETRFETSLRRLKEQPDFPKQNNEHDALSDAKWNKMLYDFLNSRPKVETLKKG